MSTAAAYEHITFEMHDTLGVLTLNRPEALNAVSMTMTREMTDVFAKVSDGTWPVRGVLLTGAGRGFCAGADLNPDQASASLEERDLGKALEENYHPLLRRMRDLPVPTVAAVNGPAAGVGMSFAITCDLILASEKAYFFQAFRHIGLVPDGGATWLLPRIVGWKRAMELSLLGERLPADKAQDWGLVNRVCAPEALMDEAMALAGALANGPTRALSLTRAAYWQSLENGYEAQLEVERTYQREAGRTTDSVEGVMAFLEKRPAKFEGK